MTIIFDLDYTLLDTKKFKAGLARTLGLNIDDFKRSYFKNKKINYNLNKHLKILNQKETIKIKEFLKKLDKYLFPESINVIKKLKKNNKLILLSFGDKAWQKQKINNLSIKDYFDEIILTDKNKIEALKPFLNTKERILIVNDNAREALEMKKVLKNCDILLTKGPYSDNIKHNEKIHSLSEL